MKLDNSKVCDGWTVSDVKKHFVKTTNYQDVNLINKTPVLLDSKGLLGDFNAGIEFDINGTRRAYTILYKENTQVPEHLLKSLFHEMVHLTDYNDFVVKFSNGNYDGTQFKKDEYIFFLIWSEFHASYKSFELFAGILTTLDDDYLTKFYEHEVALVMEAKDSVFANFRGIIRFISRLYFLSLYDEKYKNINIIAPDVRNTVELCIAQDLQITFDLFCDLRDFDDFFFHRRRFMRHIRKYKDINTVIEKVEKTRRF